MTIEGRLLVCRSSVQEIMDAKIAVFLIGSFDGSRNYGDFLQLASVLIQYGNLGLKERVLVIVEYEKFVSLHDDHIFDRFLHAIPVYFQTDMALPLYDRNLVALPQVRARCFHFYGGGYINEMWGARKRLMAETVRSAPCLVENLSSNLFVTFSGVQISPGKCLRDWEAWFRAASFIGVRDRASIENIEKEFLLPEPTIIYFSGDDASLILSRLISSSDNSKDSIAIHINLASYTSQDSANDVDRIERICRTMIPHFLNGATRCDFLIAYSSDEIGERVAAERVQAALECHPCLNGAGIKFYYRDLYKESLYADTIKLDYSFVYSCSYHVAFSAAMAGCSTEIEVANEYYKQKYDGLLDCVPHAKLSGVVVDGVTINRPSPHSESQSRAPSLLSYQHTAFLYSAGSIIAALGSTCDEGRADKLTRLERTIASERQMVTGYLQEIRHLREARSSVDIMISRIESLLREGIYIPQSVQRQIATEVWFEKQRWGLGYKLVKLLRSALKKTP